MKRKNILIIIFCIVLTKPLYAQILNFENHDVSLQVKTGFLIGTAYEILYNTSHSSDYISELQWNMKPLWYLGIAAEYGPSDPLANNALFFNIEAKFGIPAKTGVMEDRDWLSPCSVRGALTHFSSHDNRTKEAIFVNGAAGLSVPLVRGFFVRLSVDFSIMSFRFEAWDGYAQYGPNFISELNDYVPWSSKWEKEYFTGLGIDYNQFWGIIKPVFNLGWYGEKITANFSFSASSLILSLTEDNHHFRDPPFVVTGVNMNGMLFEPKGSFLYKLTDKISVGVALSYTWIDGTRGMVIHEEKIKDGAVKNYPNCGGAGFRAFAGELTAKIVF